MLKSRSLVYYSWTLENLVEIDWISGLVCIDNNWFRITNSQFAALRQFQDLVYVGEL